MTQNEDTPLLTYLLQQDAGYVLDWLRAGERGEQPMPKDFNWLGLAEGAAFRAREALDLRWAEAALRVYGRLGSESDLLSTMLLRAYMISESGSVPGHYVLGVEHVIDWFWASLEKPYEEAVVLTQAWKGAIRQGIDDWGSGWHAQVPYYDRWVEITPDNVRQLRRIKNRLNVIEVLVESGHIQPDEPLSNWLLLRAHLP